MHLILATPTRKVIDTDCYSVVLPTETGAIEVLNGHAALLTQLAVGVLRVKQSAEENGTPFVVRSGFAQVAGSTVNVLAEVAETPELINAEAARQEVTKLESELHREKLTPEQISEHYQNIRLNRARLAVKGVATPGA